MPDVPSSVPESSPAHPPLLLSVNGVAAAIGCSPRTVHRLLDAGRIPRPVRLGGLIRWPRQVIREWIAAGCPAPGGRG